MGREVDAIGRFVKVRSPSDSRGRRIEFFFIFCLRLFMINEEDLGKMETILGSVAKKRQRVGFGNFSVTVGLRW